MFTQNNLSCFTAEILYNVYKIQSFPVIQQKILKIWGSPPPPAQLFCENFGETKTLPSGGRVREVIVIILQKINCMFFKNVQFIGHFFFWKKIFLGFEFVFFFLLKKKTFFFICIAFFFWQNQKKNNLETKHFFSRNFFQKKKCLLNCTFLKTYSLFSAT